ncbi:prenyltransferase [Fervidicoccus fontis]|uniref:Prenyltransferase n=1 Tax=Fervidicoccus fontis TaxID=683846 RepID=A0A2J6N5T0_9CREN|nr:prenyltransferase [Fervidicoccus fontis]PMB75418.1 MAG: hypothetical protein C0188_03230 [Fervidicoccus fontis]PMB76694.1 MAG: hypothetical protein C0177_05450 [Fervidicoccus fontis]HEW63716.1 prenyltransferase [Fervidicoccus fontis]
MTKARELFTYARPWSFPMTIIAISFGVFYALLKGFSPDILLKSLIVILGGILFHASANLWNDYYDYKRGVDIKEAPTNIYRKHPILSNSISSQGIFIYASLSAIAGVLLGILIYIFWGNIWGIIFGIIGPFLSFIYTGSKFALKYLSLGELEAFIAYGFLFSIGSYAIITGDLTFRPAIFSIPYGFLVAAVLTANNTRDIDFDLSRGAKTLSVRIGKKLSLILLECELTLPYILTLILVFMKIFPVWVIISLASLYRALKTIKNFKEKVPSNADPLLAKITLEFGLLFLIGLAISLLIL